MFSYSFLERTFKSNLCDVPFPYSRYLTMDQTRKLLLVLESDPKAATLPLVGMYVVSHPFPKPVVTELIWYLLLYNCNQCTNARFINVYIFPQTVG